jgi:hypothetical protein
LVHEADAVCRLGCRRAVAAAAFEVIKVVHDAVAGNVKRDVGILLCAGSVWRRVGILLCAGSVWRRVGILLCAGSVWRRVGILFFCVVAACCRTVLRIVVTQTDLCFVRLI